MENRNHFDEILIRSLASELSKEEEISLSEWLQASVENRKYYEEFSQVWRLTALEQSIDRLDMEAEWEHFQQVAEEGKPSPKRAPIYALLLSGAGIAAAVILFVLAWGWLFRSDKRQEPLSLQHTTDKKENSLQHTTRHESNNSGKIRQMVLPDGSEIALGDKSELSWQEPFAGDRRELYLKGEAGFKVVKDKERPFIVYSGDLSTTVLGTMFTVTAFENAKQLFVRLYEGRVVVRSVDSVVKKLRGDIYLLPGQELVYNDRDNTASVRRMAGERAGGNSGNGGRYNDSPSLPKHSQGSWYMFNNQSLAQVFSQLEAMYGVTIEYPKKDIQKMYFIGKFDKSDSIETILRQIAALNNLTVTKTHNKFVITR